MALDIKKSFEKVKPPSIPWAKLAKLTKVQKILIGVGVVGGLLGSFVYFLYIPQTEKIASLNRDLRVDREKLERLRRVEQNLRDFKKELQETELQFKEALQLLPDKEEIPTLLSSISNLGAQSGLEFLLFRPGREVPRNFYAEIPLQLELSGPYHNVATFFDMVSRLSRIVNIGNMAMTKLRTEGDTIILKTGCTATTYKFIESAEKKEKKKR
ncbi:MAG: type 4a pilus biogenesis protein PilO [Syntrophobacteria bacterium]